MFNLDAAREYADKTGHESLSSTFLQNLLKAASPSPPSGSDVGKRLLAFANRLDERGWWDHPEPVLLCEAATLIARLEAEKAPVTARPLAEWHEDFGPVVWWWFNREEKPEEAAWIGTPLDNDWPGYHTHWTPHPEIPALSPKSQTNGEPEQERET
jgi:hypothetical protein